MVNAGPNLFICIHIYIGLFDKWVHLRVHSLIQCQHTSLKSILHRVQQVPSAQRIDCFMLLLRRRLLYSWTLLCEFNIFEKKKYLICCCSYTPWFIFLFLCNTCHPTCTFPCASCLSPSPLGYVLYIHVYCIISFLHFDHNEHACVCVSLVIYASPTRVEQCSKCFTSYM